MDEERLFRPSSLRGFLDSLGIAPNKRLSQNFLIDGNVLAKILKAAAIEKGDCILEIGPGPGALTEVLLKAGAEVIAVEKDRTLSQALGRFACNELQIFCEDIRHFSLNKLPEKRKVKVVANLPYHLTAPILALLCKHHHRFEQLTVMVQKEVAQQMVASCGDPAYGSLSLFLRFYTDPIDIFYVSPNSFYPKPKVSSAVVTLAFKKPPKIDEESFFKLTRTAFSKRRKMLRRGLDSLYPPQTTEKALQTIGLLKTARPEELSLENFLALFKELKGKPTE